MNFKLSGKNEAIEKRRQECLDCLPGFLSRILLLMNSGMTLQDAFFRAAEGYSTLPQKQKNYFMEEVCRLKLKSEKNGENPIRLFSSFGRSCGVKEVARISSIMLENQNRGTDLWERLAEEGEVLWQERKRACLERMRVGESKMSFPLGILMMALLLVTAAPAMLQL